MTEDEAFKQLAVETLGGFGWTVTVDEIPDFDSAMAVFNRIYSWWKELDQFTRDLINEFDIADGLWRAGWMYEWPGMYTLVSGNPFGRFSDTMNDVLMSLRNAHDRAPDYAAQHAVGRMEDDPAFQADSGT